MPDIIGAVEAPFRFSLLLFAVAFCYGIDSALYILLAFFGTCIPLLTKTLERHHEERREPGRVQSLVIEAVDESNFQGGVGGSVEVVEVVGVLYRLPRFKMG
jgi:hypothetical protein